MPIINKTFAIVAIALLGGLTPGQAEASSATKADKVKAAIVYKLTKFITWPEKKQTLSLCIVGNDTINSELLKINHKYSSGRRISVTQKAPNAPLEKLCDLVYIHNTKSSAIAGMLSDLANQPVLTISDSDNFVYQGGVIGLFRTGSRIQFAISQGATKSAGLAINPQLMRLAKIVK